MIDKMTEIVRSLKNPGPGDFPLRARKETESTPGRKFNRADSESFSFLT